MKVAIHQPNYLPWIGYFYKMYRADLFVFLDDVQYTKRGYTKRVKVRKERYGDVQRWLSVPLVKPSHTAQISSLMVDDTETWWLTHRRKLYHAYGNSPHFERVIGLIEYAIGEAESRHLSHINQSIIGYISNYLNIRPRIERSSNLTYTGHKAAVNINIMHALGETQYISGVGADSYQSKEEYQQAGIELQYADIATYLRSPAGLLANPLGAAVNASIFEWLMLYSNTEILELMRAVPTKTEQS